MLALSGSVLAYAPFAADSAYAGQHAEKMHQRMQKRHAQHLNTLKTKLKLSAEQESSWKTFSDAMQASGPGELLSREALKTLRTPERIDHMQALHAQRENLMKQRGQATMAFYAGLNAEQKKTFDDETARMMSRRGKGHWQGMHGHDYKHF